MSSDILLGAATAFWLGILTSISPCPLATNIAAISYVGKRIDKPSKVMYAGILYILGRIITYVLIGYLLVASVLSAPAISVFLQKYMNKALGPILILAGMMLLELIQFNRSGKGVSDKLQQRVDKMGLAGAFVLGILFALSFCPVSAALFFGSLFPLAVQYESAIFLPSMYGIATGIPVLGFAVLLALGVKWMSTVFNRVSQFERWARKVTGGVFILAGIYISLRFIFGVNI